MLDEPAKRRSNFDERNSEPVRLADGQLWHVPKPWLEIRPQFKGGKAATACPVYSYGPTIEALLEAISGAELFVQQIALYATLGAELLLWHYDLSDADLDQLLAYRRHDPASIEWSERIIAIATGRSGPKVLSAGGD